MSAVRVQSLVVELAGSRTPIVEDVSFTIEAGEIVGLVGESGSGKTTIGNALLGFARRGARIASGSITIGDTDVLSLRARALSDVRGRIVAYVPQDPSAALNPALRLRYQLEEAIIHHQPRRSASTRLAAIRDGLAEVGLPGDLDFLRRYPHQLSGGQQQRVAIAMAFLLHPWAIVLDEPTTGLDVSTQSRVIRMVRTLCSKHGAAALYVTHDLSVVANLADRILVVYGGRVVESGPIEPVFAAPAHPYTRRLLSAVPDISQRRALTPIEGRAPAPGMRQHGCCFAGRCEYVIDRCRSALPPLESIGERRAVRCTRTAELPSLTPALAPAPIERSIHDAMLSVDDLDAFYGPHQVLHGVGFTVDSHECLALVGESGSGKSTLGRAIIGQLSDWRGEIRYQGAVVARSARRRPPQLRRELQYVFQSPYNSLNPRRTIGDSVSLPIEHFFHQHGRAARTRVQAALERVSLAPTYADRYPDQLSGGERQRVAIARALVCEPTLIICDEITSALDVSVQAAIVNLLLDLRQQDGLALLFITHDLALVRSIADRVMVMHEGRLVESGAADQVFAHPNDDYTRELLDDTPRLAVVGAG